MSTSKEKKFWRMFAEIQNTGKQAKEEETRQQRRKESFIDKLIIGILLAVIALLLKMLFN